LGYAFLKFSAIDLYMVWKKGASGNPGGGRKKNLAFETLALSAAPAAFAELIRLSTSAKDERVKIQACKEILDRAYGKAAQAVELSGADGEPLQISVSFNLKTV